MSLSGLNPVPIDLTKPVPLYLQIAEDIRLKIGGGGLNPGHQLPSQHELSTEYQVSLITIKKALAHLTQQGWVYTRVGKGSFVATRTLKPSLISRSIGIVIENLQSPFFSLIMQAVEEAAYRRGYNVLLSNSSGQTEKEERQIHHFRDIGVSGLIIASLHHVYHATPIIQRLHREAFPFVMVSYMDDLDIPFVGTDHEEGARIAAKHLVARGYDRIGYLNAEKGNLVGELRKKGFLKALESLGRELDPRLIYRIQIHGTRDYFTAGYEFGQRFAAMRRRQIDALFIYNDSTAVGFEKAVLEAGLRIPQDIAVMGFDGIDQGAYATVPLTTIEQPTARIGTEAFEVLVRKIEGVEPQTRTVFMPTLVARESTGRGNHVPRERVAPLPGAARVPQIVEEKK